MESLGAPFRAARICLRAAVRSDVEAVLGDPLFLPYPLDHTLMPKVYEYTLLFFNLPLNHG